MSFALDAEIYRYMIRDYEKQVRRYAKETDERLIPTYVPYCSIEIPKIYHNDKKEGRIDMIQPDDGSPTTLKGIHEAQDATRRAQGTLKTLEQSIKIAKESIRLTLNHDDWRDLIVIAKNQTHFLLNDIASFGEHVFSAADAADELQDMLNRIET